MPRSRRPLLFFWLLACSVRPIFAQDVEHDLGLNLCLPFDPPTEEQPPAPVTIPPPGATDRDEPVEIEAGNVRLGSGNEAEFTDQVTITYRDGTMKAERANYDNGNVDVIGRVTFQAPDVSIFGEDAHVDKEHDTISFASAGFNLAKRGARGSADDIVLTSESKLSLANVLFTTCPANNETWKLQASEIELDVNAGLGKARHVKLDFKGVPILYAPYFSFPIDNQRKSGFLTPNISQRDRTGLDISAPYYLNLAPNYDLTLEPRYMSKRGVQLRSDFRYLTQSSEGQIGFEWLPDDNDYNAARRYVNFHHQALFGDNWQVISGIEDVSDETYFEDLGSSLSVTSQTHLNRFVDVGFFAPSWSLLGRVQNYQTIDPILSDADRPYERVPQIVFNGSWLGRLIGFDSSTELVNFDRNVGVTGWRLDSTQELSLRFARAGMYLTPAVALRQTNYWLDNTAPGADTRPSRGLPITSLDSGMKFERDVGHGGRSWIQTLEPRLLYVRSPFRDQSELPVFDTILPDFNLIQLFRKYQFVGPDRISDTDHVSFGVTTRLIDASDGRERVTATLGQTRYLNSQRVSLPNTPALDANASDYVAELAIGLRDSWNLDVGYQWNSDTDLTARAETRFEYRPREDRLLGVGYRYRRGLLEQGDLSVVWPVSEHWRAIGRYSYSFLDSEPLEQFAGWEYEGCCWRLRVVSRQYVSRRTGGSDSSISIQLELKGLSQGAITPESLLDRGILGYRSIARQN